MVVVGEAVNEQQQKLAELRLGLGGERALEELFDAWRASARVRRGGVEKGKVVSVPLNEATRSSQSLLPPCASNALSELWIFGERSFAPASRSFLFSASFFAFPPFPSAKLETEAPPAPVLPTPLSSRRASSSACDSWPPSAPLKAPGADGNLSGPPDLEAGTLKAAGGGEAATRAGPARVG